MMTPLGRRCSPIRLIVLDVDGVMSQGGIYVDDNAQEHKRFHVRDGAAIAYWRRSGRRVAIISGRECDAVKHRSQELGIERTYLGRLDKGVVLDELMGLESVDSSQVCVIGDDLADLSSLKKAGLAVAVADAAVEVRHSAHFVTYAQGGWGAVRELIELLMRVQGTWSTAVERYRSAKL